MVLWPSRLHKRLWEAKSIICTLLWYRRMFYEMGTHSFITPPFFPFKPEYVEIGSGVSIGSGCRIEVHPAIVRNQSAKPLMKIGDRVKIGHHVNLRCHKTLVIGSDVFIEDGCFITDYDHLSDPEGVHYVKQPLSGMKTVIEKGVWLGPNVCVQPGSYIGERSIIRAGSIVNGVIPPYSVAVGAPAKVIKHYDFKTKEWVKVTPRGIDGNQAQWVKELSEVGMGG